MGTDPRIGTELGGYRIESLLERGGMSVVYLAEQEFPKRKVALKLLAPELAEDQAFRERFIRESNAAALIDDPNIVPIYGAGEADGVLYIAMRYVEGTDLRKLLDAEGPLDPVRAVSIVSQAASALDAAHARGLVHRDVKPGNLLLTTRGSSGSRPLDHVYVSDFGLIKRRDTEKDLTRTGQVMGSVDYIAPEQIEGRSVDGRADVYSLGCVLYECLIGEPPFRGEVDAAVMYAHLKELPRRPSDLRPELPHGLDDVVARALAKSPEDRYATCGEMAEAARVGLKPGVGFTGCEVTHSPILNDKSFNQAVYEGLTRATAELGIGTSVRVSKSEQDYAPNIQECIDAGCSLIVAVGFPMQEATAKAARANPDQRFALVDPEGTLPPNVLGLAFQTDQAAFLAGYLAAGMSRTGKVATLGGQDIPPVTIFMDGFAAGILKYNRDHGTTVQLLGWDPATGVGSFVSEDHAVAFYDRAAGRSIAEALISGGADVVLPVAGEAGLGAVQAARHHHDVLAVGVDTDQFISAPEFGPIWLTSIRKRIDLVVEAAMRRVVDGTFEGGMFLGTLENGGVDLAPFHELDGRVPKALKVRLEELKAGIVDGSVSVDPQDYLAT